MKIIIPSNQAEFNRNRDPKRFYLQCYTMYLADAIYNII